MKARNLGSIWGLARLACVLLACALLLTSAAMAEKHEFPDLTQKGSITIKMVTKEGEPAGGGEMTVYQIAEVVVDNGFVFSPLSGYEGLDIDMSEAAALSADDAQKAAAYVANNGLSGKAVAIGDDGLGKLTGLDLGLYLVVETKKAPGFRPVLPFLMTIPYDQDGKYQYDVTSEPKMTPERMEPLVIVDPPVEKIIKGKNAPADTKFQFEFKSLDSSNPMPVNAKGSVDKGGPVVSQTADTIVLQVVGAQSIEVGDITFTEAGEYCYQIRELNTGEKNYKYDDTVYWSRFEIVEDGGDLVLKEYLIKIGDANGKEYYRGTDMQAATFTFTNEYEPPETPPPHLPQTGQLWWPVALLLAAGAVCVAIGVYRKRRA